VLCIGWWLCAAAMSSAAAVIRVGINASYPPFETVDDHGRLSGFDIDLVNAWAKNQGVQVKFVNLAWPHLLESLTQGRVDMVVSAVAVTAERSKAFAFSRPYYYEPQVMVLSAGRRVQDPRSLTSVGVLSGSSSLVWLTRLKLRSDAVKLYDGLPPMISDLSAGKIQAAFGDQHAMRRVSASDPNLHQLSQPEFGQDAYAFVVRKGQRALLERANKGLAALETSGTLARLKLAYPGL
jgi:ABC-type amino acid transport substrate-binding protein